ncbi:MAG TPA: hypothetical protein ENN76_00375, partial [Euryarchaeota archaeon]|nr:hypothetical protein [Euryarchaeota archaeon]
MDLSKFTLKDIYLSAIKSEVEAATVYQDMANKAGNDFLKNRLEFLSKEEIMHSKMLKKIYLETFPQEGVVLENDLPPHSVVPMPMMIPIKGGTSAKAVLKRAMEAEKAASQFYLAASEIVDNPNSKMT